MHDIIHQLEKKREAARLGGGQKQHDGELFAKDALIAALGSPA